MIVTYNFTGHVIQCGGESVNVPIDVTLEYDAEHDPLAVDMILQDDEMENPVTWTFARDLLVRSTNSPFKTGSGDIRFRTADKEGRMYVCLRNPVAGDHADLALPIDQIRDFLTVTTESAAQCLTTLDSAVDAFIAEVLG